MTEDRNRLAFAGTIERLLRQLPRLTLAAALGCTVFSALYALAASSGMSNGDGWRFVFWLLVACKTLLFSGVGSVLALALYGLGFLAVAFVRLRRSAGDAGRKT